MTFTTEINHVLQLMMYLQLGNRFGERPAPHNPGTVPGQALGADVFPCRSLLALFELPLSPVFCERSDHKTFVMRIPRSTLTY